MDKKRHHSMKRLPVQLLWVTLKLTLHQILNGDDVGSKVKILSCLSFSSFINHDIHIEGIKRY